MTQKSEDGWTRLSVPKKLIDKVKEMMESEEIDCNSVSSFVQDAIRRRIEELEIIRLTGNTSSFPNSMSSRNATEKRRKRRSEMRRYFQ